MKLNHVALVLYAVITTILILAFEWGVNLPVPELSQATRQQYQLTLFINSSLIPLTGVLIATFVVRMINKQRFHIPGIMIMVLMGGLLFMILKPVLMFIHPTVLALLVAIVGTACIFYLYQVAIYYTRKSATI